MDFQNPNPTTTPMYKVQSPTVYPISPRRLLLYFSQCFDVVSKSKHLSIQVIDLLRLILNHSIDFEIRDVIGEISTKRKEVKEKKELLELVKVILELSEKLRFAKEELRARRVVEATETMRELKVVFGIRENALDEEEMRESVAYGLLRKE